MGRRIAADVSERRVAAADRYAKRQKAAKFGNPGDMNDPVLHIPREWVVSEPEPVDTRTVNGRLAAPWEEALIAAAVERERRAGLELLAGLVT